MKKDLRKRPKRIRRQMRMGMKNDNLNNKLNDKFGHNINWEEDSEDEIE